jgi:hypothetical protein
VNFKAGTILEKKEYVAYCPECDGLHVVVGGYVFKNEFGPFVKVVELAKYTIHDFYLVGEL